MNAIAPDNPPSAEDHAYFLTIERTFLGLRKKAALLTAADWQEAQGWHRQGIPIELIQDVMEKLFERQQAKKGRTISGLRYFRAAVEAAWEEMLALRAGGRAEEVTPLPVGSRLANLAAALPGALPHRQRWNDEIGALAARGAPASEVEVALRTLDAIFLRTLREGLAAGERHDLAVQAERALARLRGRLAEDELAIASERLAEQLLRRHFDVPVLSLFSPEARGEGEGAGSQSS
ncbi:MAG: hypothetical protein ABIV06_14480 [Thermoanaerobaculia bacterium]